MLTVDDISKVEFDKSINGYRTNEVDDFLDECADTVAALIAERDALNQKLEVLADKVVEYRDKLEAYQKEEDSIKLALISAQRTGDSIVREANQKADLILKDAEIKAQNIRENAEKKILEENEQLLRIRQDVSDFKAQLFKQYKAHLELIDLLPEVPNQPEETVEETITDTSVAEPQLEQLQEETTAEEITVNQEPVAEQPQETQEIPIVVSPQQEDVTVYPNDMDEDTVQVVPPMENMPIFRDEKDDFAPEEDTANGRFSDIRFGDDYDVLTAEDEKRKGFFKRKKS